MAAFKQALPAEICDPSSLGRICSCTLLPIATAALVCRQYGRSPASLAWLRAFLHEPVPDLWLMHKAQHIVSRRRHFSSPSCFCGTHRH